MDHRILTEMAQALGPENVLTDPPALAAAAADATFLYRAPAAVLRPRTTAQVASALAIANREGISITTRGRGTSLVGGSIPSAGGLALSLERMDRILEVDPANGVAVAEAGAITGDLDRAAGEHGLFYPPDPSSVAMCSIGGNVSTNAGGLRCLKYGVTKDYVLGMTVVLADGRVLELGGKLLKNVTGYQLMQLIIGSEGTLGVVTQVTVKLRPLPRVRRALQAYFPTLESAGMAVTAVLGAGILPAILEMMDGTSMDMVTRYEGYPFPAGAQALLLLEQDGNDHSAVAREGEEMAAICEKLGAYRVDIAQGEKERQALWQARRSVALALAKAAPAKLGEDIVVPRANIPAMVSRVQDISARVGLTIAVFGHAGDGNLHPNILFDPARPGEIQRLETAASAIIRAALELGGTLTGEHGVGTLKREFLEQDVGTEALSIMRAIKHTLDPKRILNPDVMFPTGILRAGGVGFLDALPLRAWNASRSDY